MLEKEKNVLASPAMGKRGAEHLPAKNCSPGAPSRANSTQQRRATPNRYKGVRVRGWGKWVTETSDTQTKGRIWLGSFDTEEMAARAYDSAVVSLKGPNAKGLNFPDSPPRAVAKSRAPKDIKDAAEAAAIASAPKATPLVTSKKKMKVSSSLSTCDSRNQECTPDQGEPSNDVREESAPPARTAATMEEWHTWIDRDFTLTDSGPFVAATGMESYTGIVSNTYGCPGTYLEVYDRLPYMSYEEEFRYVGRP